VELPRDLREALDSALSGAALRDLADTVSGLIERYRAGGAVDEPILTGQAEVLAYAGYRMPATYAAVRSVLAQTARVLPEFAPAAQLDVGGGTGAAAWAGIAQYPGLSAVTVLDQGWAALVVGERLAARSALHRARWDQGRLEEATLEPTDLVTVSYVLGELTTPEQHRVLDRAAAAAQVLVVVEPGTPAGYRRILAARDRMLAAGLRIVAPCPHEVACPIVGRDWCHFSVRVNRTSVHRRLKQAELGYEDEKFSYVVGARTAAVPAPGSRVVRRPQARKGLVSLRLCTPDGSLADENVSKRQGERYRAARDLSWGDSWPSVPTTPAG
jgi:ribosomal protein RSM22 (predicted rRNA methylase)